MSARLNIAAERLLRWFSSNRQSATDLYHLSERIFCPETETLSIDARGYDPYGDMEDDTRCMCSTCRAAERLYMLSELAQEYVDAYEAERRAGK